MRKPGRLPCLEGSDDFKRAHADPLPAETTAEGGGLEVVEVTVAGAAR